MWNLGDILAEAPADLYAVLGVAPDANIEAIKKAFRQRAKESHPDRHPNDPSAEERFKDLQAAYCVLSDPQRRQQYDMSRGLVASPAYSQRTGSIHDFIMDFFSKQQGFPVIVININDMVDGAYPEDMPDEMPEAFTNLMNFMGRMNVRFEAERRASHKVPRKPSKTTTARLTKLVTDYVLAHGGRQLEDKEDKLVLFTDLGPLFVYPQSDWIACYWEDVEAARQHFGVNPLGRLNPYSGKWNFGCGENRTPDDLFEEWRQEVEPLLGGDP